MLIACVVFSVLWYAFYRFRNLKGSSLFAQRIAWRYRYQVLPWSAKMQKGVDLRRWDDVWDFVAQHPDFRARLERHRYESRWEVFTVFWLDEHDTSRGLLVYEGEMHRKDYLVKFSLRAMDEPSYFTGLALRYTKAYPAYLFTIKDDAGDKQLWRFLLAAWNGKGQPFFRGKNEIWFRTDKVDGYVFVNLAKHVFDSEWEEEDFYRRFNKLGMLKVRSSNPSVYYY